MGDGCDRPCCVEANFVVEEVGPVGEFDNHNLISLINVDHLPEYADGAIDRNGDIIDPPLV